MAKIPVTVWSKPNCVQCEMTKKLLDRNNIIYQVKDLTDPANEQQLNAFIAKGLMQAPIVTTDTKTWAGFKPNKIESLAQHIRSLDR